MRVAAVLHDIGKIGIPEAILNKPDRLNVREVMIFRTHPIIGSSLLGGSKVPMLRMAHDIALYHHERWDGSGTPRGYRGRSSLPRHDWSRLWTCWTHYFGSADFEPKDRQ